MSTATTSPGSLTQWSGKADHRVPLRQFAGVHDEFGPGTRIPALVIGTRVEHSSVDHTVYDTTSIMRTIEAQRHLQPVGSSDAAVNDLGPA